MAKLKNRFQRRMVRGGGILVACAAIWGLFVLQPELGIWRLLPKPSPADAAGSWSPDAQGDQYLFIVKDGRRQDVRLPRAPETSQRSRPAQTPSSSPAAPGINQKAINDALDAAAQKAVDSMMNRFIAGKGGSPTSPQDLDSLLGEAQRAMGLAKSGTAK